jgi:DNA-directed RNA polymerase specialized sigma24 family protein
MTITTINASEDQSQYVWQIYQEHYARLQHYFLIQLGNDSEAEDCVHETMRRFFFFMEGRSWEAEAEYIFVYLMRIAGLLCSRKLGEKRAQRLTDLGHNRHHSLFNKIRTEAIETMKERIDFMRSILRSMDGDSKKPSV